MDWMRLPSKEASWINIHSKSKPIREDSKLGLQRGKSEWVYGSTSEIICKACGTRQAKFYGTGEAVPRYEQNYCHYCGCLMTYNLKG